MVINKNQFASILSPTFIFIGFIACGVFTQYTPLLRYLSVSIVLILALLSFFNAIQRYRHPSEQIVTFLMYLALVQLFFNITRNNPADLSIFLVIILGYLIKSYFNISVKLIATLNFFTISIMIYELVSFSYFIDLENNKFEFGRLQGLFSYSKEAGYYVIAASFYLFTVRRLTTSSILGLLAIATLSGTRTAILFVISILFIKFMNGIIKISYDKLRKFIVFMLMSTLLLYVSLNYYFVGKSEYMIYRFKNSFNFVSSSHQDRLFFWRSYLEGINDYSWYEIIFGAGTKLNIILGNGAESFYLMILSQYGLITLVSILSIFILIVTKANKIEEIMIIASLLVILFVGRIGVGWADGILIWAAFFHILDRTKGLQDGAYQVRLQ